MKAIGIFTAGCLGLAAFGVAPASAQSLGNTLLDTIFGSPPAPAINYSERPPLVLPPKRALIEPTEPVTTANDPSWPLDTDVQRAIDLATFDAAESRPDTASEEAPLLPSQLENPAGIAGGLDRRTPNQIDAEARAVGLPVLPSELRNKQIRLPDEAPMVAGVEPPRRSLADPPPGYRAPVATAPADGSGVLPSEATRKKKWFDFNDY